MVHANPIIDVHAVDGPDEDAVVQLREWGTDTIHVIPRLPGLLEVSVGRHRTCAIRLQDRRKLVSRVHAKLVYDHGRWLLRDLNSINGIFLYGARLSEFWLEPGDEIDIGYVTLIAESRRTIELRAYLSRLLGWDPSQLEIVDLALRSIRSSVMGSGALVLCGEDDLVPIARSLHRRMLGADRPFIVCDPARCQLNDPMRPENYDEGVPALAAAAGGTLCVRHERLPNDFANVAAALRHSETQVQLTVCARSTRYCARYLSVPITIPPLRDRIMEIDRVIAEYAQDAFCQLGHPGTTLSSEDLEWVRRHSTSSIAAIEKATLRLAAIRSSDDVGVAAARLRMSPTSLSLWIARRKVPMAVACSCCSRN